MMLTVTGALGTWPVYKVKGRYRRYEVDKVRQEYIQVNKAGVNACSIGTKLYETQNTAWVLPF